MAQNEPQTLQKFHVFACCLHVSVTFVATNLASVCKKMQVSMDMQVSLEKNAKKCNHGFKINPEYLKMKNHQQKSHALMFRRSLPQICSVCMFFAHRQGQLHFPSGLTSFQCVSGSTCPSTCNIEVSWKSILYNIQLQDATLGNFQGSCDSNLLLN